MKNVLKIFAILITGVILLSFIESVTISGTVKDEDGNPLQGVRIFSQGTASYVVSDQNGFYKITVSRQVKVLVFAYKGFPDLEEQVLGRQIINVTISSHFTIREEILASPEMEKKEMSKSYDMAAPSTFSSGRANVYRQQNQVFNTEGYAGISENTFRNVKANPLSTFSIDVDNASYSNIRRFINNGQLPPADAVRIEEMINYFRYNYPEQQGEHPFSVLTELSECPWNKDHQLLLVGLKGKTIDKSTLPPSNLVFLIDVSGSMSDVNKLPLLKSAFGLLVNELRPQDRVAIVVYAGAAGLVLESTPGNRKEAIMSAIDNLEAGGSTAGGAGLKLAYHEAEKNFIKGGNNRIILATDGDFNVGESSNGGMERLVEEKRGLGVFITVLGFGMGNVKDDKMEIIADKGNGNYAYIDNLQEARKVLVREFGGTLFTIAKDVKFQVEFNPAKISSYRLIGYENRLLNEEDFNNDSKDAGEMGAGHNVTALYELVPTGSETDVPLVDPLRYQISKNMFKEVQEELLTVKIRYKRPDGFTSMMLEKSLKKEGVEIEKASSNIRFAAAVAEFGMILRDSEYKGTATIVSAVRLAKSSLGDDEDGYRSELIRLMNLSADLGVLADGKR